MKRFSALKKFKSNIKLGGIKGIKKNNLKVKNRPLLFVGIILILLLGSISLFQQLTKKNSSAAWWNGDYKYRKSIRYTNTGSGGDGDRKVKIEVDTSTLISAGKMQSDCDDVRFTDNTGKTLDYFIDTNTEDCNTSSTDFYVKVAGSPIIERLLYMYYGNSSITRSDLGGRKNDFFDDTGSSVGLKAYWKLNESSGDSCDVASTTDACNHALINNGTWTGNATTTTTAKLGGRAVTFDGTGDYIQSQTGSDLNLTTSDFTLSAWFKTSQVSEGMIVTRGTGGNSTSSVIRILSNGTVNFRVSTSTPIASSSTFNDNNWHHVVGVADRDGNSTLYIDGTLVATGSIADSSANSISNAAGWRIGIDGSGANGFNGQIDDVRIFKRAITTTDIASIYNNGLGQEISAAVYNFIPNSGPTFDSEETTPGPIAYWKFDEGQGQTVNDSTKHTNTGTLGATSGSSSDDPTWKQESDCVVGKCLQFDGSADYVKVPDSSALDITGAITVSTWIKQPVLQTKVILSKRDAATAMNYQLAVISNGTVQFCTSISTCTNATAAGAISTNVWTHISVTFDGSSLKAYINGRLVKTTSVTDTLTANNFNVNIGSYADGTGAFFNGFIDEPKIYPYARSAAEVKADYSSGAAVLGASDQKDYLSDGLVGYWKMDEASANTCTGGTNDSCDSSGNGRDGAWNGNATTSTTAKFGRATTFDGTTDYISMGDVLDFNATDKFTLSAWVKTSTVTTSPRIFDKKATSSGYYWRIQTNGTLSFQMDASTGRIDVASGTSVSGTAWKHVVLTNDGAGNASGIKMYVDGVPQTITVNTNTLVGTSGNTTSLNIGADSAGGSSFNGQIDEARIYNRTLSADDVRNLYNWAPGPAGYWNMDEGSGQVINDISISNASGTLGANSGSSTDDPTWKTAGSCKYGSCLNFDGTTDVATTVNNTSLNANSGFTIEAWMYRTGDGSSLIGNIAHKWTGPGSLGWSLDAYTGDRLRLFIGGLSTTSLLTTTSVPRNTWTHVVGKWDGTTMSIYINGKLDISQASSGTATTSTAAFQIGFGTTSSGTNNYFAGSIDDVRFYDYPRTSAQIIEDMNASHPLGGSPVGSQVAYFPLDEQQGTVANNRVSTNAFTASAITTLWRQPSVCKINGCYDFNGTSTQLTLTHSSLNMASGGNLNAAFTISAWINPDSAGEGAGGQPFYFNNTTGWVRVDTLSGGRLDLEGSLTNGATLNISSAIPTGSWTHIAMSFTDDGDDEFTLWINGKAVGTSTGGSGSINGNFNSIIFGGNSTSNFDGRIDEAKIYNTELTQDQMAIDYNNGSSVSYSVLGSSEASTLSDGAGNPPVAEYNFNEKTGQSANDTSGNGNTATLGTDSSSASDDPTWESAGKCKSGSCLSFDGTDDYVTGTDLNAIDTAGAFTFSLWVYRTGPETNNNGILTKHVTASTSHINLRMKSGDSDDLFMGIANGTAASATTNSNKITANAWHHIAVVFDGSQSTNALKLKIYIDGQQETLSFTGILTSTTSANASPILIGKRGLSLNDFFPGSIDEVKIYNYARTASQIAYDYNRGLPVGHWRLDECQGSTAYDSSGFGNNGTISIGASGTQTSAGTCSTSSTAWGNGASGKYSSSLNFDGTDDYINIGTNSLFNFAGTSRSISLWFKTSSSSSTATRLISKRAAIDGADANGYELIFTPSTGTLTYSHTGVGSISTTISNFSGKWVHVLANYNGTAASLSVNGIVHTNSALGVDSSNSNPLLIGRNGSSPLYFPGQIDDIRIYNYALSASQVNKVVNEGSAVRFGQ